MSLRQWMVRALRAERRARSAERRARLAESVATAAMRKLPDDKLRELRDELEGGERE